MDVELEIFRPRERARSARITLDALRERDERGARRRRTMTSGIDEDNERTVCDRARKARVVRDSMVSTRNSDA